MINFFTKLSNSLLDDQFLYLMLNSEPAQPPQPSKPKSPPSDSPERRVWKPDTNRIQTGYKNVSELPIGPGSGRGGSPLGWPKRANLAKAY